MSPAADPLAEQCSATSKATGARCRRRVTGGGPCIVHGGKAPQVAAKRLARVELGRLRLAGITTDDLTPAESLLAATRDADQVRQALRSKLAESEDVDLATLDLLGQWVDRTGRLSRSAIDAAAQLPPWLLMQRLEADEQAAVLLDLVRRAIANLPVRIAPAEVDRAILAAIQPTKEPRP